MPNANRPLIALLALVGSLACASGRSAPSARVPEDTASRNVDATGKSVEQLFVGKFPGVDVRRADNGGLSIRIRGGNSSFYGGSEPLYIVDGTEVPVGNGGIIFINPNDIQKIEVLKNPADVGVYGVRGANGVIKITTTRPRGSSKP